MYSIEVPIISTFEKPKKYKVVKHKTHYNINPVGLTENMKLMMWPTHIIKNIFMSSEVPATNKSVLKDNGKISLI